MQLWDISSEDKFFAQQTIRAFSSQSFACSHTSVYKHIHTCMHSAPMPTTYHTPTDFRFRIAQETINVEKRKTERTKEDGKCAVFIRWPRKLGSWYYVENMKWKTTENIFSMCTNRQKKKNISNTFGWNAELNDEREKWMFASSHHFVQIGVLWTRPVRHF